MHIQLYLASYGSSRAGAANFHLSAVAVTLPGWRFLPGRLLILAPPPKT